MPKERRRVTRELAWNGGEQGYRPADGTRTCRAHGRGVADALFGTRCVDSSGHGSRRGTRSKQQEAQGTLEGGRIKPPARRSEQNGERTLCNTSCCARTLRHTGRQQLGLCDGVALPCVLTTFGQQRGSSANCVSFWHAGEGNGTMDPRRSPRLGECSESSGQTCEIDRKRYEH
ncbi:hypothetical protein ERJ75_001846400 [Trypanosoma vivax]|nr:hypothetical protein ERJ75_001846400 [Trypanosoma vivax]